MKIQITPFGKAFGKQAFKYTMTTDKGASCTVTDAAGALVSIRVPDKNGKLDDVVLGFDDVKQYVRNPGYLGALIGPVGNRIAGSAFTFEGKQYTFRANEGTTLLHSGDFGFHTRVWDAVCEAEPDKVTVCFTQDFAEQDTGFPGDLKACVSYTFTEDNALRIHYHIESDKPTFLSPTNHAYFNIAGLHSGKRIPGVGRQSIQIFADRYTAVDGACIPVSTDSVEGTPFDLRSPVRLSDGFALEKQNAQLTIGCGYDHNYVLSDPIDLTGLRPAARVADRFSGRVMNVYTDMPCVQLYTANHLRRVNKAEKLSYNKRNALCLETQCAPDSVHHPNEDGYQVLTADAGKAFDSTTVYAFSIK